MATPNYSYEKRQRELAKKRKAEEKRQRKLTHKDEGEPGDTPTEGQAPADDGTGASPPPSDPAAG